MKRWLAVVMACTLAGCISPPPKPLVDLKAVDDQQAYQKDLIECVTLADYYFASEANGTIDQVKGATIKGATSGITAALPGPGTVGSVGTNIGVGFGVGLFTSAIDNERDAQRYRNMGIGRCLENRGYEVINAKETYIDPKRWCYAVCLKSGDCTFETKVAEACIPGEEARQARLKAEREARRAAKQAAE